MVTEANKNQEDINKETKAEGTEPKSKTEKTQEEGKLHDVDDEIEIEDSTEKHKKKKSRKERKESEELEELKIKNAELNDKFLRLFSEFDNFRKRTLRERIELTKTASTEIIMALLPVMDDFDRAFKALEDTDNKDNFKEGITLIHNKFKSALTAKGLQVMKSIGETFDTDFHEAITEIPAPDKSMKGKIIDEVEKGYMLGDKVIRYAKVVVGS